jgi:SAM-dependent methyltransferase
MGTGCLISGTWGGNLSAIALDGGFFYVGDMAEFPYIHGFSPEEQARLRQQARFSEHIVYQDVDFTDVSNVLEVGCGVGAQSEILLRRYPSIHLTAIDRSSKQLACAREFLSSLPFATDRFELLEMDASTLEFDDHKFDGAFITWLLEHVSAPGRVLGELRRVLRPGGRVYISEVMNSTFLLDPYSPNTWAYWLAFNDYQIDQGGDPFVGAKLGNLLLRAGFENIRTTSKVWHLDDRTPGKRKAMIEFWAELLLSACEQLVESQRVSRETVNLMKDELRVVAREPSSTFYYAFMQATATT